MSHELRTPLNSILILGQQLSDNPERNLSPKQVEFARTIHGAGTDLLNLITDILDLSKIESGTVTVEAEEIFFTSLLEMVVRTFKHDAENRGLSFEVQVDPKLGRSIVTDSKRLQQVLKNLLSNAFKFTSQGGVRLIVSEVAGGWTPSHPVLSSGGAAWSRSRYRIRASAFRPRSSGSSSRRSSRPMPARAGSSAARVWAWPSAASCRTCWAARFSCAARRASAARSRSICRCDTSDHRSACRRRGPRGGGTQTASVRLPAVRVSERPTEVDRRRSRQSAAGRCDAAHRRRRSALRAHPRGPGSRQGVQGPGGHAWQRGPEPRTPVQPDGGVPRRVPAGHARLDRPQPIEAGPRDAAYPCADRHARRRSTARAGSRRLLVRHQANDHRGPGGGDREDQVVRGAAPQAPAGRRRQRRRAD